MGCASDETLELRSGENSFLDSQALGYEVIVKVSAWWLERDETAAVNIIAFDNIGVFHHMSCTLIQKVETPTLLLTKPNLHG